MAGRREEGGGRREEGGGRREEGGGRGRRMGGRGGLVSVPVPLLLERERENHQHIYHQLLPPPQLLVNCQHLGIIVALCVQSLVYST